MLLAKSLPPSLWIDAVRHAAYLRNRAPTRAVDGKTPFEAWNNRKPNISHLREFGCDVWVLDESKERLKLDPKARKMAFVGFEDGSKSVQYYDATTDTVKVSRNVAWNNNETPREVETLAPSPALSVEGEKDASTDAEKAPAALQDVPAQS